MTWPPHRPGAGDLRLRAGATLQIGATAPNDLPLNIMSSWSHRWVSGVVPARTGSDSRTVVKHRGTTVQLTLRPRVPLDGIAGGRRGRGGATGGSDEPGCERLVACRNSGPVQGGGVWSGEAGGQGRVREDPPDGGSQCGWVGGRHLQAAATARQFEGVGER